MGRTRWPGRKVSWSDTITSIALDEAFADFHHVEAAVADFHGARLHHAVLDDQDLVHHQGAGGGDQRIFAAGQDDVHLAGHAGADVVRRILEVENDDVALERPGSALGRTEETLAVNSRLEYE